MLTVAEIERLQKRNSLLKIKYNEMASKVNDTLVNYFQQFTRLELYPQCGVEIKEPDLWYSNEKNHKVKTCCTLSFKAYKEEDIKRGREVDFVSDIRLVIFDDCIELNYSCSGEYSNKDLSLVQRAILVARVWEHEQEILDLVNSIVDINVIKELNEIRKLVFEHDEEVKELIHEQKKQKIIEQLNSEDEKYIISYDRYTKENIGYSKISRITNKFVFIYLYDPYFKIFNENGYEKKLHKENFINYTINGEYKIVSKEEISKLVELKEQ